VSWASGEATSRTLRSNISRTKATAHYAYIHSPREAYKVLVEEMGATLVTVAKDVKIQVEFNPAKVGAYRLIGYENRIMAHQDFNDDTRMPAKSGRVIMSPRFTRSSRPVKTRRLPRSIRSSTPRTRRRALQQGVLHGQAAVQAAGRRDQPQDRGRRPGPGAIVRRASDDLKFACAVAGFGMLLRDSPYKGSLTYAGLLEIAQRPWPTTPRVIARVPRRGATCADPVEIICGSNTIPRIPTLSRWERANGSLPRPSGIGISTTPGGSQSNSRDAI